MKTLAGSITATLLGIAMLAVGVAGVAGSFDGKSDSDSSSSSSISDDCAPVSDSRLQDSLATFDVTGPAGHGLVVVQCQHGERLVSMLATSLDVEKPPAVALWLYGRQGRKKLVAASAEETVSGALGLTDTLRVKTDGYRKWVVTAQKAGDDHPKKPGKLLMQGTLSS
jgi:hypothetical protein